MAPSFARLLLGSGPRFLRDAFGATVIFCAPLAFRRVRAGLLEAHAPYVRGEG